MQGCLSCSIYWVAERASCNTVVMSQCTAQQHPSRPHTYVVPGAEWQVSRGGHTAGMSKQVIFSNAQILEAA